MTQDVDSVAARLQEICEKRGYLLPHHGLLAVMNPALLSAYDELYSRLALEQRQLSRHDHEAVWLAILLAMRESLATHHIARFRDAGGSDETFASILRLVACLEGVGVYDFVAKEWQDHLAELDMLECYLQDFRHAARGMDTRLAHLCASAVHATLGQRDALGWQIIAAYQNAVPETELAEALSLMMFPGSVPRFVRAAATWRHLILDGQVNASEAFRSWADVSGQGGFDQAVGLAGEDEI